MEYNITYVKEITYQTTVEAKDKDDALQVWGSNPSYQDETIIGVNITDPTINVKDPHLQLVVN